MSTPENKIENTVQRNKYNELYNDFICNENEDQQIDSFLDFVNYQSILSDKKYKKLAKLINEVEDEIYYRMKQYDLSLLQPKSKRKKRS